MDNLVNPTLPFLFYFSTSEQGGEIQEVHVPNKGCQLTIVSAKEARSGADEIKRPEEICF